VALGKEPTTKNTSTKNSLPSVFYQALGKDFTECKPGTRQRKVDVTAGTPSAHALPSAMSEALGKVFIFFSKFLYRVPYKRGTQQRFFYIIYLPSALPTRHSVKIFLFFFRNFFAECPGLALGKAGNSAVQESPALSSARSRALGK
jgi:hypothetical protein